MADQLLTVKQYAERYGVTVNAVYYQIKAQRLKRGYKALRVGSSWVIQKEKPAT